MTPTWKFESNRSFLILCVFMEVGYSFGCVSLDRERNAVARETTETKYCNPRSFLPERELSTSPIVESRQEASKVNGFPTVYIYSLPVQFNQEIRDCISPEPLTHTCFRLDNEGFGELMYSEGELGVYNTHQFSLEVIIHEQLMNSKYRTLSPTEADVFYIPAYVGSLINCPSITTEITAFQNELFDIINAMPYFEQGRPHLTSLARIEREMAHVSFPVLSHRACINVTFLTIERETDEIYRKKFGLENRREIVVPYPSYAHRKSSRVSSQTITSPNVESRTIFVLLAACSTSSPFREIILNQFRHKVSGVSYEEYSSQNGGNIRSHVFFETPTCLYSHVNTTIKWMQHSVFCLQPPGDSPTRKSFYDSIQSGCIPVVFKFQGTAVVYPFERVINYADFVVSIPSERITNGESIFDILESIAEDEVRRLHDGVLRFARQLQYSVIDTDNDNQLVDAIDMIMADVKALYGL